jgi:hypothetical protein
MATTATLGFDLKTEAPADLESDRELGPMLKLEPEDIQFTDRGFLTAPLRSSALRRLSYWVPAASIVSIFIVIGQWVYFVADDFCRAAQRNDLGFIGMQINEYRSWAGRFTSTGLIALTVRFGLVSAHIVPAILIALCLGVCTLVACRFHESTLPKRYTPLVGTLFCVGFLGLFENFGQSVLWFTGGMTYFVPYLLLACALLCAFPKSNKPKLAKACRVCAPAIMFLAVGCNEAVGATIVGTLVIACGLGGRALRRPLIPSTLGAILGFAVMIGAPGNALRRSANPQSLALLDLPVPAALSTLRLLCWLVTQRTLLVGMAVIIGMLVSNGTGVRRSVGLGGFLLFCGVSYGAVLLGFLSTGTPLTPRTRISAVAPMIAGIILLSWAAHDRRREQKAVPTTGIKPAGLMLCALATVGSATRSVVPAAIEARNSSSMAKQSTRLLITGRGTTTPIAIPGPNTVWGLANFAGDGEWVLRCVDQYYNTKGTYVGATSAK